jgi:hypothetical protein
MQLARGSVGRTVFVLVAVGTICSLWTLSGYCVEIEVVGDGGAYIRRSGTTDWVEAEAGDRLTFCDLIKLPGNHSWLKWRRSDGVCTNKGTISTNMTKFKHFHVGIDIFYGFGGAGAIQAGLFDLVVYAGEDSTCSDACIEDGSDCEGSDHCGISAGLTEDAFAWAAPTAHGYSTTFYGMLTMEADGYRTATFWNRPESDAGAVLTVEWNVPGSGMTSHDLYWDQWMRVWEVDGSWEGPFSGPAPQCDESDPSRIEDTGWGAIKALYR